MLPSLQTKVLQSYTERQLESIKRYYHTMYLIGQGESNLSIHKQLGVTLDNVTTWKNNRHVPFAVKSLEEFETKYCRPYTSEELMKIAYLVGYNLGDGHISRNFCHSWFYGVYEDLIRMSTLFADFGVTPVVYKYKINNGKMAVHCKTFSRLLYCFGAVTGDKTKSNFSVPRWILCSDQSVKRRFLQGLFDSELSAIIKSRRTGFSFQPMKFFHCKSVEHTDNGMQFLSEIRHLLSEFCVETGPVTFDRRYIRGRDGKTQQQMYFLIRSNYQNLSNFIQNVGFLYNSKRQGRCDAIHQMVKEKARIESKKTDSYYSAMKLRKEGLSAHKIAAKLDADPNLIKNWVYRKTKPRSLIGSSDIHEM